MPTALATVPSQPTMQEKYREALDSLIEKVKQDREIIAAILCGSLSYDQVWEKSDIDLIFICKDEKVKGEGFCLVENGINIHASLMTRGKFKAALEGSLQNSFFNSLFSRSTLLYSTDETIEEYYQGVRRLGARDREMELLRAGSGVMAILAKAEKWLYVKKDPQYSFVWITWVVNSLAGIEMVLHGEVTSREVIQRALELNPEFFGAVYTDLVDQPKTVEAVGEALRLINAYLDEHLNDLFQPILDYLSEVGGIRSTTEMDEYFKKRAQMGGLALAYEWLADKEIIRKVSTPLRLTERSRITVDEAAYYYDGE